MYSLIVTGAAGRRDDYQLPLALFENNLLENHVTDFYLPDFSKYFLTTLSLYLLTRDLSI